MAKTSTSREPQQRAYAKALGKENKLHRQMQKYAAEVGPPVPEVYFATVRAIGTPLAPSVIDPLKEALELVNFYVKEIKVSERLLDPRLAPLIGSDLPGKRAEPRVRYERLSQAARTLRRKTNRSDALIMEAVRYLHYHLREEARREALRLHRRGVAYVFRSVMSPAEAKRLRKLYDAELFIISAFSPEVERRSHLASLLANGDPVRANFLLPKAEKLLREEKGHLAPLSELSTKAERRSRRVNIPETWEHADLFLDTGDVKRSKDQIERLVQLMFGHPFRTPRPDEVGMAEAFGAALESANLARPVGAAVISPTGEIISIGTNNVPQPGGGIYRGGVSPDHRDHTAKWRHDPSDINRRGVLRDLLERMMADPDWLEDVAQVLGSSEQESMQQIAENLRKGHKGIDYTQVVSTLINSNVIHESQLFDVIEYGRTLHAEMDAITSAARKTLSTRGSTMYCTTMPCHECARLIIGAGIKRVIFIEPYEKSRAMELYHTEILLQTMTASLKAKSDDLVHFIPYVGISPRRFQELFSWVTRKRDDLDTNEPGGRKTRKLDGRIVDWSKRRQEAPLRDSILTDTAFGSVSRSMDRYTHERNTIREYEKRVAKALKRTGEGS